MQGFCWGNLREMDHLGDPCLDGRIILKRIYRNWDVEMWIGTSFLGIETGGGRL
jgi:hypothetical protein